MGEISASRGPIFRIKKDPFGTNGTGSYDYFEDGLLLVSDGKVEFCGLYEKGKSRLEGLEPAMVSSLILPGFVDTHIHYPQVDMIAGFGNCLLEWLEKYTFPAEAKLSDVGYARELAKFFLAELLRNGTTTALVCGTVHEHSVEALFEETAKLGMRLASGKMMMDRAAPAELLQDSDSCGKCSRRLIEKWHRNGRLQYAVTPRFGPTSTKELLDCAGELIDEHPDVLLHTHLAENFDEIKAVEDHFGESYLNVYDRAGLVGDRSIFAHGVHLAENEFKKIASAKASLSFCPTSNMFLGSGLFPFARAKKLGVQVSLGTDIGAGTSFSLFQTMGEAYKVGMLQCERLTALQAFYFATLGGAEALNMQDKIGTLKEGSEADFVVLDFDATPLLRRRLSKCKDVLEKLFVMMTIGDDRLVKETWVAGKKVYSK